MNSCLARSAESRKSSASAESSFRSVDAPDCVGPLTAADESDAGLVFGGDLTRAVKLSSTSSAISGAQLNNWLLR